MLYLQRVFDLNTNITVIVMGFSIVSLPADYNY